MESYQFKKAEIVDLPEILVLQHLAYLSEPGVPENYIIPSLRQTLQAIELEYQNSLILKATDEKGRIIGSIRGHEEDGSLYIGKLIVHPKVREKEIGMGLLNELERLCPKPRYELLMGCKSDDDLRPFKRLGYRRFKERQVTRGLKLVSLEKLQFSV